MYPFSTVHVQFLISIVCVGTRALTFVCSLFAVYLKCIFSIVPSDSRWMEVILGEKDAGDWIYRGEGAANLVLAYGGSSSGICMFIRKIVRSSLAFHYLMNWNSLGL